MFYHSHNHPQLPLIHSDLYHTSTIVSEAALRRLDADVSNVIGVRFSSFTAHAHRSRKRKNEKKSRTRQNAHRLVQRCRKTHARVIRHRIAERKKSRHSLVLEH